MQISRRTVVHGRGRFVGGRFVMPAGRDQRARAALARRSRGLVGRSFRCPTRTRGRRHRGDGGGPALGGAHGRRARLAVVATLSTPLAARSQELIARLHREQGRPLWECEREVRGLVGRLQDFVENAGALIAERRPHLRARVAEPTTRRRRRRRTGHAAAGTSYAHILAALVAGNSVVWKPSPLAASSAQLLTELLQAGGLPVGVFNMVQGDLDVARRLVADRRVHGLVFAGSSEHGRELAAQRADLRVVLHLGAKNPAVVLDDADVEAAARQVAQAAFLSAGQRCTALSRVLVQRDVLGPFAKPSSRDPRPARGLARARRLRRAHVVGRALRAFLRAAADRRRRDAARRRATRAGLVRHAQHPPRRRLCARRRLSRRGAVRARPRRRADRRPRGGDRALQRCALGVVRVAVQRQRPSLAAVRRADAGGRAVPRSSAPYRLGARLVRRLQVERQRRRQRRRGDPGAASPGGAVRARRSRCGAARARAAAMPDSRAATRSRADRCGSTPSSRSCGSSASASCAICRSSRCGRRPATRRCRRSRASSARGGARAGGAVATSAELHAALRAHEAPLQAARAPVWPRLRDSFDLRPHRDPGGGGGVRAHASIRRSPSCSPSSAPAPSGAASTSRSWRSCFACGRRSGSSCST